MRLVLSLAVTLLVTPVLSAQVTRREIVNATTPAEDSKPGRVLVLRFKFGTDLLAGFQRMVEEHKIRNAVILSAAGSVRNYQVHTVSNREFPSKNVFTKDPTAPADIVSMNGYIIDGRIHAHMTRATPELAFGGHLEPETTVFTFAIVTVGVFNDAVDLARVDDKTYR
jgi:predicted DNA-binding protein with PD1-like motif